MQIIHTVLQSTVGHSPHMQTGQKKKSFMAFQRDYFKYKHYN